MYITGIDETKDSNGLLGLGTVKSTMLGELPVSAIAISKEKLADKSAAVTSTLIDLDSESYSEKETTFAFAFKADGDSAAFQRYIDARKPALEKYNARELLSCMTERTKEWDYDTFELIQFPEEQAIGALMSDPFYIESPDVQESTKIFGGGAVVVVKMDF